MLGSTLFHVSKRGAKWRICTSVNWVFIGLGAKSLPELMLTYHKSGFVAFTWWQNDNWKYRRNHSLKVIWKLYTENHSVSWGWWVMWMLRISKQNNILLMNKSFTWSNKLSESVLSLGHHDVCVQRNLSHRLVGETQTYHAFFLQSNFELSN